MREAFVGFDSAWAGKTPGGLAWACFSNRRLERFVAPKPAGFDDAARTIRMLRCAHDYVLAAIDQPTVVPNLGGSRPVDRIAGSLIGRLKSGVQPANRGKWKAQFFGDDAPVWKFLTDVGARENPPAAREAREGRFLIEVFPALALTALEPEIMRRKQAARYNPRNRKKFSLGDWKMVAETVRWHAEELHIPQLAQWAAQQAVLPKPTKRDQDLLDSALCLIVTLLWRRAPHERMAVIGDGRTGYMVTPVTPETRAILERKSGELGVPIDTPWPGDAMR